MYAKEKQEKKNAEIAFKRILNKMYNDEKYSPNEISKNVIYYSNPVSPEPKIYKPHHKKTASNYGGLDVSTVGYSSNPMSPKIRSTPVDYSLLNTNQNFNKNLKGRSRRDQMNLSMGNQMYPGTILKRKTNKY
jgi:hypothetical protein